MVQAWIYDSSSSADPRAPHYTSPVRPVSLDTLASIGVCYWRLSTIGVLEKPLEGELGEVRKQRGYGGHDVVNICREKLPNYDEKIKMFFEEHLHEDEEIRFCLDGSGYFDARSDVTNEWIRIHVTRGDMIVLPAGMYHRFTLDENNYIQAMRLFKDAPKWEAINRGEKADKTSAREQYLKFIQEAKEKVEQKEKEKNDAISSSTTTITSHSGVNGESFILHENASSLANYPHLRAYGGLLYVSGISSRRPDNTHVGATLQSDGSYVLDIAAQTAAVLDNISAILLAAGSQLADVVDCTVFLADMSDYAEYNKVYNKYFPVAEKAPTRTTVAVKQLPHKNLLIEIKAIAVDRRVAQKQ